MALLSSNTSADFLAADLLAVSEILLRLSSPVHLVRAALASRRWLDAVSSQKFLREYRARYPSSPLLGLYVPRQLTSGLPSFHLADSVRSGRALSSFVHRGDFDLSGLDSSPNWRLLDCHGGRLLLSDSKSLVVYGPASGRRIAADIPACLSQNNDTIAECLLWGNSDDSPALFRVICVQHRRRDRMVRAVEYDSHTRRWRNHPWAEKIMRPQRDQAMRAGRFVFWRYEDSSLLVLDTRTMGFSTVPLPCAFFQPRKYAIGDTEDGGCCLVGLVGTMQSLQLHVWLLQENGAVRSKEPDTKVPVSQVRGLDSRLSQVHAVSNGLAFLCQDGRRQFAVDLNKMCVKDEFECLTVGYPFHMPWPPALLVETGSDIANGDDSHLEASSANKVDRALHDSSIQENNAVNGGPHAQTAPMSQTCNVTLHDKLSEANYLSENTGKNRTDVHKCGRSASVPTSAEDGEGKDATEILNKENFGDTSVEISVPSLDDSLRGTAAAGLLEMTDKMPFYTKDQDINDSLGDLPQQDLCIKCGKDGQLLKCSSCLLTAHDSCFGSSATFEETGLFYCRVCFYTKATEAYQKAKQAYSEARKNLAAFLGRTHLVKQHDEQPVLPGAANRQGHSNGGDSSKRKNIHQSEADNLAHQDDEPHRQKKQQKINAKGSGYPEQVVTEKVPLPNSDVASMNKHTVLKNNSSKRVQGTEKQQQVENKEAHNEAGNENSSPETRSSSQKKCCPPANQEVEADSDREDDIANSHQHDDSNGSEDISSFDSGNRSSPPWRNMRHKKATLHEKETMASCNSRKSAQQDQRMPSLPKERKYAYPQKRCSNRVVPSGRRSKLYWTEEEEEALKEAMAKFAPQDDQPIPWVHILEYGSGVFHRTRLPPDLRVKWRNMKKRAGR